MARIRTQRVAKLPAKLRRGESLDYRGGDKGTGTATGTTSTRAAIEYDASSDRI